MTIPLQAVSIHRHTKKPPARLSALPPRLREALLTDLSDIERLAIALRRIRFTRGLTDEHRTDRDKLTRLLNDDVPYAVRRFAGDWFNELIGRVRRDRELLLGQKATDAPSGVHVNSVDCSKQPPKLKMTLGGAGENELLPVSAVRWQKLASSSPAELCRQTELLIEGHFQRFQSDGWLLADVRVVEQQCPPGSVAEARGWVATCNASRDKGLIIELRVPERDGGNLGLTATISLAPDSRYVDHGVATTPKLAGPVQVWKDLTEEQVSRASFVHSAASILRRIIRLPRKRLWKSLFADLTRVASRASAEDSRLLSELAHQAGCIGALAANERQIVSKAVQNLLPHCTWRDVQEYGLPVVVHFTSQANHATTLYRAIVRRAPAEPRAEDVDFLFHTARQLQVDCGRWHDLIEELGALGRRHPLSLPVLRLLRDLLAELPAKPIDATRLQPATDFLCGLIVRADESHRRGTIASLCPSLTAFRIAGLPETDLATLLEQICVPVLVRDCPRPQRGVWQTCDQQHHYIAALRSFIQLVQDLQLPAWDIDRLAEIERVLPHVPDPAVPGRYPSEYWPILRAWLSRKPLQVGGYQREVATWLVQHDLACTAVTGVLGPLGDWLRKTAATEFVYAATVTAALDHDRPDPQTRQRIIEALVSINGLSPSQANGFRPSMERLLNLRPWPDNVATSFHRWLTLLLMRNAKLDDLALPGARGLLRGPEEKVPEWASLLTPLPSPNNTDWDVVVGEFEQCVDSVPAGDDRIRLLHTQLDVLAVWRRRTSADTPYSQWKAWLDSYVTWSQKQPRPSPSAISSGLRLLILSGCLRSDHKRAWLAIRELWPAIPAELLIGNEPGLFKSFIKLCLASGALAPLALTQALAVELSSRLHGRPERDQLAVLEHWNSAVTGTCGAAALVAALWPKLPARLICADNTAELKRLHSLCSASGAAITDRMAVAVACEVLAGVEPSASPQVVLDRFQRVSSFYDKTTVRLWNGLAALAQPNSSLSRDRLLAFAKSLFGTESSARTEKFHEEVWRQAHALHQAAPKLAQSLVSLLVLS